MPQLMPLMWVFSIFWSMLIVLMYIDMYYYSFDNNMLLESNCYNENYILFKW